MILVKQPVVLTAERSQSFGSQAIVEIIRTKLMQNTTQGHRIRQQSCHLPHTPVVVDGIELSCVQKGVPIRHVDLCLLDQWTGILELWEQASGDQVMIILVDLPKRIAYL